MINALGAPQSLLLLGGTSDIALAIARTVRRAAAVCGSCWRPGRASGAPRPPPSWAAWAAASPRSTSTPVTTAPTRRPSRRRSRTATSTSRWSRSGCWATPSRPGRIPSWRSSWPRSTTRRRCTSGCCSPSGCGPRRTAGSWRCPAWPASGYAAPTSSTARPRPASTASSSAWARRCATTASACWSSGPASSSPR